MEKILPKKLLNKYFLENYKEINSHHCQIAVFKPNFETFIVGCYLKSPEKEKASSKIEAAYKVVIKFIKWYNKNEKISNSLW